MGGNFCSSLNLGLLLGLACSVLQVALLNDRNFVFKREQGGCIVVGRMKESEGGNDIIIF